MTDTDSSPDDVGMVPKRDSKKKKKKSKKKRVKDTNEEHHHATIEEHPVQLNDTTEEHHNATIEQQDDIKKSSKKKKKKEDKKRKRNDDIDNNTSSIIVEDTLHDNTLQDVVDNNTPPVGNDTKSKKKKKKKRSKKDKQPSSNNDTAIVSSSAIEYYPDDYLKHMQQKDKSTTDNTKASIKTDNITLLLFYQYVEPPWDEDQFQKALQYVTTHGEKNGITGRMRVAREGLNCTLTGSYDGIRAWCAALRKFDGGRSTIDPNTGLKVTEFANTEFKLTDDLPLKQRFPKLHPFEVVELVNYGLAGSRAPPLSQHGGTHLEPTEYHKKMCESDTVIIDVRNHYEANIGRFNPPAGGAQMIDPKMRKSTEFPIWLENNKEKLRGKQVLMYCTGGVRCERASALLKQKIDKEDDTKALDIKGVYQLQGGVDKYFKEFPTGGLWKGKNYTFDKRFAHAPPAVEAVERTKKVLGDDKKVEGIPIKSAEGEILGKCEACNKPWDMYRGKRRCPTCGVPSLICRECFEADKDGTRKLGREVRCDLCVTEDIRNKRQLKDREEREMKEYEQKLQSLNANYEPPTQRKHAITRKPKPNPNRITRLFLKNMCAKQMDESKLLEVFHPAKVTHIQWLTDRNTGKFYGSAFIEVKTSEDAGTVLAFDKTNVLGRKITVRYQQADAKDIWPIPNTEVSGGTK